MLPKSPKGRIKVTILPTYTGKSVLGNYDVNTQEIVATGVFTVTSHGINKPLTENLLPSLPFF